MKEFLKMLVGLGAPNSLVDNVATAVKEATLVLLAVSAIAAKAAEVLTTFSAK